MNSKNIPAVSKENNMLNSVKNWIMIALALIFVVLYAAVLFGWLKPISDMSATTQFGTILFVIIGYFFGSLPAEGNERSLKDEIARQTQKTDAAQYAKEKVIQEREVLEEKIRNVRISLKPMGSYRGNSENASVTNSVQNLESSIKTALNILDS
jgi:hypothetical protein